MMEVKKKRRPVFTRDEKTVEIRRNLRWKNSEEEWA